MHQQQPNIHEKDLTFHSNYQFYRLESELNREEKDVDWSQVFTQIFKSRGFLRQLSVNNV